MNRHTALVVGLVAIFATAMALPAQSAFAATINATIVKGATNLADKAYSPNPINAAQGDTVTWTNADTAAHTVTQGNPSEGQVEGGFDSGIMGPNKTFSHTFDEEGNFAYYCLLHPTMVGTVLVGEGGGGDNGNGGENGNGDGAMKETEVETEYDGQTYTIKSKSENAHVIDATINPSESVGVDFEGSGPVELTLPRSMIENITMVSTDEGEIEFQEVNSTATDTTISFTLPEGQTFAEITGTKVVPEFGVIAALILAASLVAMVGIARFKGSSLGFGRF